MIEVKEEKIYKVTISEDISMVKLKFIGDKLVDYDTRKRDSNGHILWDSQRISNCE